MVISIGSIPIGTVRNVQNNGTPVGSGGFHTINLTAGGASAGPSGIVNVASTGPTGPTGPSGPTGGPGPTGPTGPTGPGFSSFSFQNTSKSFSNNGTGSHVFTFGFNVKMAAATAVMETPQGGAMPTCWVTGVSISGTQVTVNYSFAGTAAGNLNVGCGAAG